jgi:tetratricopeptide (TPR) repeat protein
LTRPRQAGYDLKDPKLKEKPIMPKERVDRKRLLKEPDEFITTSARAYDYLKRNSKWVTGLLILVCVVGAAVWGWRAHQGARERQAQLLYSEAYKIYASSLEQTDEAASRDLLNKAMERFQTLIQQFGGTRAGWMGRVHRGHAGFALKRYDEALHDYEAALREIPAGGSLEMKALVLQGLGHTWMAKGDLERAISFFRQLKAEGGPAFERTAQWDMARCYELQGTAKEALQIYEELQSGSIDTMQRELAKAKVAELAGKVQK